MTDLTHDPFFFSIAPDRIHNTKIAVALEEVGENDTTILECKITTRTKIVGFGSKGLSDLDQCTTMTEPLLNLWSGNQGIGERDCQDKPVGYFNAV